VHRDFDTPRYDCKNEASKCTNAFFDIFLHHITASWFTN